ncbi:hypothetical protein U9M48_000291 [Paspalum notatum var. saurae]|uniref:Reverse transcriptase Ty1/copia-type domain-containing protein n=1 Tax=Paspalum notatum var. saurae TaxID=547442 RepID=A0AAQ3PF36_PASNO
MAPSTSSNGGVPVLHCALLFDGTNYRVWVPRMRWHMRGLRLWEFLTGELPCPPCPQAPANPVVPEKATDDEKQKILDDFVALEKSYEAQFSAYRLWLDEDACASSIVVASMQDQFAEEVVDFQWSHQMWSFLRDRYEPTGQSAYFAAIRREQLICHGDLTVDELYTQLSAVWRQIDSLRHPLSPSTCEFCQGQQSDIELQRTYAFLTRLRDEYEPLRAQLLARHPFVSLIDALTDVRNEETRLRSAGLLPSVSALAAHSAPSRPAVAPPSLPSSATAPSPSARGGGGGGLHCDYCGKDGHVEAFCYRKKKAQRSQTRPASQTSLASQPSASTSAGVSQRSSTDPVTQEMLMLLRRLAASSPSGTASIATLPTGSSGSATASQSSAQGPPGEYLSVALRQVLSEQGIVPPSVVSPVESPSESSSLTPDYTTKPPVTQVYTRRSAPTPTEPTSDEPSPAASSPELLLRRGHRFRQPVDRYGFGPVTWQGFAGTVLSKPLSYRDAILHPEWQLAMAEEIAALERTGTWDLVPTPSHVHPITCKWVYKVKTRSDGSLERYKARLVARGFQQEHGRDYDETFAPVAHMTTVRALLAVASVREWSISQLDVKNAFLNGELREEAPRAWFQRFASVVTAAGFSASPHDPALFVHTSSRGRTLLLLYVDDMIITGDDPQFIAFVKARFFCAPEGFYRLKKNIFSGLLDRASLTDHKTEETPMELNLRLSPLMTKKQTAVSRSSTEAELRAMALVTAEILVFLCLYRLLFCRQDTGAISIARDPVKHELTKHIGVDAYYTRAQVQDGVVTLRYVPSELQLADFLTKAQTRDQHRKRLDPSVAREPAPAHVWPAKTVARPGSTSYPFPQPSIAMGQGLLLSPL